MPSIFVGTRARMQIAFSKDDVLFDPQLVTFTSEFTPKTVGEIQTKQAYTYNVDVQIVRSGVGTYYVEQLFSAVGSTKFTWRSLAYGEELVMEEICRVNARSIIE